MPPGFVGYVMEMDAQGAALGARDAPQEEEEEERHFVSPGEGSGFGVVPVGLRGARGQTAPSSLPRTAPSEPPRASAASPCGGWRRCPGPRPKCEAP